MTRTRELRNPNRRESSRRMFEPDPRTIRRMAAEIRHHWTAKQRLHRAAIGEHGVEILAISTSELHNRWTPAEA